MNFVGSFPTADFQLPARIPEIAFVGRSNVGKSSLINAVTGSRGLARVSKTPGKTRACNVFDVDGRWYLVDLPGYGFARVPHREREAFHHLLESYLTSRQSLAGVVWVLDIRRDLSPDDRALADRLYQNRTPILVAIAQADKLPQGQRVRRTTAILGALQLPRNQSVVASARTGEGVDDLRDSIEALAQDRP